VTGPEIVRDLVVILVGAKLAGAAFERVGQPAVVGEILGGVLLGAHNLGVLGNSDVHQILQRAGAVVLLFAVGLDTPFSELKGSGRRLLKVSISGMALPFAAGAAFVAATGGRGQEAIFIGAALVSTSVGVTARVLSDMREVGRPESRVILGAAVLDDILGLLVLAVVAYFAEGRISMGPIADGTALIGAFVAGLLLAETGERHVLRRGLHPVYWALVPFFFVVTGARVDLGAFTDTQVVISGLCLLAIAIGGKFIGCAVGARSMGRRAATIVGVGMVPRGEIGVLIAAIGLAHHVIARDYYAIVVGLTVVTTMLVPPILKKLFRDLPAPLDAARQDLHGIGG
jgi:Kef-type K+ transport system membrane component KefB